MSEFRLGYLITPKIIEKIGLYTKIVNSRVTLFINLGGVEALSGRQDDRIENQKNKINEEM